MEVYLKEYVLIDGTFRYLPEVLKVFTEACRKSVVVTALLALKNGDEPVVFAPEGTQIGSMLVVKSYAIKWSITGFELVCGEFGCQLPEVENSTMWPKFLDQITHVYLQCLPDFTPSTDAEVCCERGKLGIANSNSPVSFDSVTFACLPGLFCF